MFNKFYQIIENEIKKLEPNENKDVENNELENNNKKGSNSKSKIVVQVN